MSDNANIYLVCGEDPLCPVGDWVHRQLHENPRVKVVSVDALMRSFNELPLSPAILLIQAGDALTQCLPQFARWMQRWPSLQMLLFGPVSASDLEAFYGQGGCDLVPAALSNTDGLSSYWQAKLDTFERQAKVGRQKKQATRKLQAMAASLLAVEEDQALGASVQKMLMPEAALNLKGLTVAHDIRPSLMLTGDFIQYSSIRAHEVLFCLADVSGHGTGSALVTVLLNEQVERLVLMAAADSSLSIGRMMAQINEVLCEAVFDHHVTCVLGIIDLRNNQLRYCSAGHFPHPLLVQNGAVQVLEAGELPLGLLKSKEYDAVQLALAPEFKLLIMSDGVLQGLRGEALAEKEATLKAFALGDSGEVEGLLERLFEVSDDGLADDASVLSLVRKVGYDR
ncbi:MAG: serine/threonine-protein phosphatase [Pseudomonadales bacterium]|nr:serine/threonine-protein phosphatase [Pseudomonadales bacterium]